MYFLTGPLVELAKRCYQNLEITEAESGDKFFSTFGPGNIIQSTDKPFERFSDYETLLDILYNEDPEKYESMHKGTPFYFLSWLAFDLRNFEKALFYMDAAISEDILRAPDGWMNLPAASFLTLTNPEAQVARRTVEAIRNLLAQELDRFNALSGLPPITIEQFTERFVKVLLVDDPQKRTIITAFYTFLLEFRGRRSELRLRSTMGGSIQPFITHLFKGGLILESLLKHLYPTKDDGTRTRILRDIFKTQAFRDDFVPEVDTSSYSLHKIVEDIEDDTIQSAFNTTAKLRNTTGHNLVWDDIFDPTPYRALFTQEVNALFYLVAVKFS